MGATVYRRTERDDWLAVGRVWSDGSGWLVYRDAPVAAGTRYGYRLGVAEEGTERFLGETWVEVPVTPELALAFRSNPAGPDLGVTFTLPDATPARLEVFDVAGRRIAAREVGALGAGNHVVTLSEGHALAPGLYVARLSQGNRWLTARTVLVR
jgi:hypothetical protein